VPIFLRVAIAIMALRKKIPVLPPDASVEAISQAATVASSAVESLVETAEAGVGVRQEDLGLNIGEFDLRTLQGFDREMQRLKGELRIRLNQLTQTEKDIKDVTDHIAREDRKLQAPDATEEDLRDVRNRKKTLEDSLKTSEINVKRISHTSGNLVQSFVAKSTASERQLRKYSTVIKRSEKKSGPYSESRE
jgi:Mg2+ and Co2+ transporter CorA